MSDTHSISGSYNETSVSGAFGLNAQDTEVESDSFWAQGTLTSRGTRMDRFCVWLKNSTDLSSTRSRSSLSAPAIR